MNVAALIALLIALGTAIAIGQTWRNPQWRAWRVGLQLVAATLLWFCLEPPLALQRRVAGALVVLTPGATPAQQQKRSFGADVVALPGVDAPIGVERVPDLATALRRHPGSAQLEVIGGGLPLRDRDAARGLVSRFDAAPLPPGVVALNIPSVVLAGHRWRLDGRIEGATQGRVELRSPDGAVVADAHLDDSGRFALSAQAKQPGEALFSLRALDRDGARVDDIGVPVATRAGEPTKVILLAGAPDADLKYLRRWAIDAGITIDSRIALSEGVALREGSASPAPDALRASDLAIVDERAWATLGATDKAALIAAVRAGMGLLIRITGPVPAAVAADWAALGYTVQGEEAAPVVELKAALALDPGVPPLTRRPIRVDAPDAASMLRADDGSAVALWRNAGSGRIGLWWLADSFRLTLAGDGAAFGSLWSDVFATLARSRGAPSVVAPTDARVDQRSVLCDIASDASVQPPQGETVSLRIDPATGARSCAGFWPRAAGWHVLRSGDARTAFYVRASDEAVPLALGEDARATAALVGTSTLADSTTTSRAIPMSRWSFFLAWLGATALLWWIERRRTRDDPAE